MNGIHFEASGDPSIVAGASVLASFSNMRKEFSFLPPPSCDDEDAQPALPTLPFDCEVSNNQIVDADLMDAADENDGTCVPLNEKVVHSTNADNENINFNSSGHDNALDAEIEKVPGTTPELRLLFQMLSGSSAPEFDLSSSISKILEEQKRLERWTEGYGCSSIDVKEASIIQRAATTTNPRIVIVKYYGNLVLLNLLVSTFFLLVLYIQNQLLRDSGSMIVTSSLFILRMFMLNKISV